MAPDRVALREAGVVKLSSAGAVVRSSRPVVRHFVRRGFAASRSPFDGAFPLRHHTHPAMKRFGWTHFGVMIPSLPAPHRYLGMMTMAGETGQQAFDVLGE